MNATVADDVLPTTKAVFVVGDVMVIVGAAHFGGSSGLTALLKRRGIKVERIQ